MNTSTVCHLINSMLDFIQLVSAAGQDLGGSGDRQIKHESVVHPANKDG